MTKDLSSHFRLCLYTDDDALSCESEDKTFSTLLRAKLLCVGFRVYIKKRERPPLLTSSRVIEKNTRRRIREAFYFSRDFSSFERGGKGGKGRGRGRGVEDDDSSRGLVGDRDDDDSGRQRRRNGDEATAMFRGRFSTIIIIIIIVAQ